MSKHSYDVAASTPTQVAHPARATIRTAVQVLIALAALAPVVIATIGVDETLPIFAGILAASAAITRVAALPQVEAFLARFIPWLATGVHTEEAPTNLGEDGEVDGGN